MFVTKIQHEAHCFWYFSSYTNHTTQSMLSIYRRIHAPIRHAKRVSLGNYKHLQTQNTRNHISRHARQAIYLDWQTLNTEAYYIGKSIILFIMFYCTLNWALYRHARKRVEQEDHKK